MQTIQLSSANAASASTSLFGQQNAGAAAGASDPFAMLMALLSQGAATGTTDATANLLQQNLPGTSANLPTTADAAQLLTQNTASADVDPTTLKERVDKLLAKLEDHPALSKILKKFFGKEDFSAKELQERLASMSEEDREALHDALAAAVAIILPYLPWNPATTDPVEPPTEVAGGVDATDDAPSPAPVPAAAQSPNPDSSAPTAPQPQQQADSSAPAAAENTPLPTTQAESKQAQHELTQQNAADDAARETSQTKSDVAAQATAIQTSDESQVQQAQQPLLAAMTPVSNPQRARDLGLSLTDKKVAATNAAKAVDAAAAATANINPEKPAITQAEADLSTSVQKKAASLAGNSNGEAQSNATSSADAASQTTTTPVAQKAEAVPFADHLKQVSLNRTGAHMPVSDQIAVHMTKAVKQGQDHFTVRLQPAGLGRIEVKVDLAQDGRVTASFKVDQPATLDLLQRDQHGLERALTDAGLKTDSGSLNFNLRDGGSFQRQQGQDWQNQNNQQQGQGNFGMNGEEADNLPAAGVVEMTWIASPDRLDVHI